MDREWVEGLITGLVLAAIIGGAGVAVGLTWRRGYLKARREAKAEREADLYLTAPGHGFVNGDPVRLVELAADDPGPIGEPRYVVADGSHREEQVLRLQREVRERDR